MSNCCYVQIDAQNEVIGASQLAGTVERPELIATETYRPDLIGCAYDPEAGTFTDTESGQVVYTLPGST